MKHDLRVLGCSVLGLAILVAGCADSTPEGPSSADRALKDPWGYTPKIEKTDIGSKNDTSDQGSLKKDLDHVFNP